MALNLGGERIAVHLPQRALLDTRDLHPAATAPFGELPLKVRVLPRVRLRERCAQHRDGAAASLKSSAVGCGWI